ncbi:hypothetical protein [Actinoplanes couchii]|uniref:Uncharacterized protein n=1 Tax=Actinoplanes couchii TaxID=403638 RepID=A0ABQ3XFH3_9ACTN|nr:hypothetical protein [Actinoplanes couchii]MDR6321788.1 hypothetical protein [Actinoplanes couchii]GID57254.1 hypothetical protein Aco03nite_056580 [Actinoplanes couchii]
MDLRWWSIEILDATRLSAEQWRYAHQEVVVSAAVGHGARAWEWHEFRWGVLFEVAFTDDEAWAGFRVLPAVQAALDAVPDPINGLLIHPGRGGASGQPLPRRPKPVLGSGAAPVPQEPQRTRLTLADTEPMPTSAGVYA